MLVTSRICSGVDSVDPRHLAMSSLQSLMVILHGCCTPLYCTRLYCVLCTVPRESGEQCPYIVQAAAGADLEKTWAVPGWARLGSSRQVNMGQSTRVLATPAQCSHQPVWRPDSLTNNCFKQFNPSKPAKYGGEIVSSEHV